MNILFYIEPLIELDDPYWKSNWFNDFCLNLINVLNAGEHEKINFQVITNEPIAQTIHPNIKESIAVHALTQKELLKPFGTNYQGATKAWHMNKYLDRQLKYYMELSRQALKNFIPDIIITFTPVPFLKALFPNALILHHEFSIFSRLPYPKSWFFDPVGVGGLAYINKYIDEIVNTKLTKTKERLVNSLKNICKKSLKSKSPFKEFLLERQKEFEFLVYLPLQFSGYYLFDDFVKFKSQYEYCVYVLDNIPKCVGVVVSTHPAKNFVLNDGAIKFLTSKYKNFIYSSNFKNYKHSGQLILPYVDGVVSVSSSIGLQALLLDKKIFSIGKHFECIADGIGLKNMRKTLRAERVNKNSILYFILTHYAIREDYISDPLWLYEFLKGKLQVYRNEGLTNKFFSNIDRDDNIFKGIVNYININSHFVPEIIAGKFIQLFYDTGEGFLEKNSIKITVDTETNSFQKIVFNVEKIKNIKKIRIDPLNDVCIIEVKNIFLKKFNSTISLNGKMNSNSIDSDSSIYYFTKEDPNLILDCIDAKDLMFMKSIILEMEYLFFGREALKECINRIKKTN